MTKTKVTQERDLVMEQSLDDRYQELEKTVAAIPLANRPKTIQIPRAPKDTGYGYALVSPCWDAETGILVSTFGVDTRHLYLCAAIFSHRYLSFGAAPGDREWFYEVVDAVPWLTLKVDDALDSPTNEDRVRRIKRLVAACREHSIKKVFLLNPKRLEKAARRCLGNAAQDLLAGVRFLAIDGDWPTAEEQKRLIAFGKVVDEPNYCWCARLDKKGPGNEVVVRIGYPHPGVSKEAPAWESTKWDNTPESPYDHPDAF